MAIYIDKLFSVAQCQRWPYGSACHLFGSDRHELHNFAFQLGLCSAWFQNDPHHPHYRLTPGKRNQALCYGAIELTDEQAKHFWEFGSPNFEIRQERPVGNN